VIKFRTKEGLKVMPSPSEAKDNVVKETTEKENLASDDGKKKQQSMNYNASPRRKCVRSASANQNGNRQNRNNSGNKRPNDMNNNNKQQIGNYKQPQQQHHHAEYNKKQPQHQKYRSITKNGNYHYESPASAPPSLDNEPIEKADNVQRKYSMDFLHQVGYKMSNVSMQPQQQQQSPKTPKIVDDANLMALKIALGDNSGYYTHFYSGSMYGHGNQMILQQQQQQQQYQTYSRYQQSQQHLQRLYGRNYQRWPTMYEPEPTSLPCHCPQQQQIPAQRSYQQTYTNSPTYQPRGKNGERREYREYRPNDSKKTRHLGFQNDRNFKSRDYRNIPPIIKTHSLTEEDVKRHTNQSYRSLSPTPPGSSKSSSPGAIEKSHEEDSASTSSGPSYNGDMKVSLSAPVLLAPDEPVKSVNLWINNNFGGTLHNGLSYSAEHLNIPPITIIKRPPSSMTGKRNFRNSPSYDPQYPFDYYLSRCDESEVRVAPISFRSGTKYDRLSEQMWEKFQMSQQSRITYHSKMVIWRDLYNSVKVSFC
jgi:hypothetical protein